MSKPKDDSHQAKLLAALEAAPKRAGIESVKLDPLPDDHWRQAHLGFIGELSRNYAEHERLAFQAATQRDRRRAKRS